MIQIRNLTKVFRRSVRQEGLWGMIKTLFSAKYTEKIAVDHIDMDVADGEIVGYIGSNGAGKSTTIKMMCGILTPTEGTVLIDGVEPYKKRRRIASKIGVVFGQKTQLWWDIPLVESFKVLKEVYLIPDEQYQEQNVCNFCVIRWALPIFLISQCVPCRLGNVCAQILRRHGYTIRKFCFWTSLPLDWTFW